MEAKSIFGSFLKLIKKKKRSGKNDQETEKSRNRRQEYAKN